MPHNHSTPGREQFKEIIFTHQITKILMLMISLCKHLTTAAYTVIWCYFLNDTIVSIRSIVFSHFLVWRVG